MEETTRKAANMTLVDKRSNYEVVKKLERHLESAKSGNIDGFAIVYTGAKVAFGYDKSSSIKSDLIVGVDMLKKELLEDLSESITDIY